MFMENFSSLVRSISSLFITVTALIAVVFLGLFLYLENPAVFIEEKLVEIEQVWTPRDIDLVLAEGFGDEEVEYGYHLIRDTPNLIGPGAEDPELRFAGNSLACASCHLDAGTKAGSGSWVGITECFPQFNGRSNKEITLEDRINGCMERSMNGHALPEDSREIKAIVAYMNWLSDDVPQERQEEYKGFPSIEVPNVAVDLERGAALYRMECATCHMPDGQGTKVAGETRGYLYPPLWGEGSYNDGAGMHRVITAARFIKGNMPFGEATLEEPILTDEEAYHLAGYINSFSRPEKPNKEADFPDLKLKPVSTPYGPWEDAFSADQHKYGPFPPIQEYYKTNYGLNKDK